MDFRTMGGLCMVSVVVACGADESQGRDLKNDAAPPTSELDYTTSNTGTLAPSQVTSTGSSSNTTGNDNQDTSSAASSSDGISPEGASSSEGCTAAFCDALDAGGRQYDPCVNKECGEVCSLCPDSENDCIVDGVGRTCNASGECRAGAVLCAPLCLVTGGEGGTDGGRPRETCIEPDPSAELACDKVEFVGTDAECVEQSWIWDGSDCQLTTHCGCSQGDCDRLYGDYPTCKRLHAECLPRACRPEDAQSNGTMCGSTYGYAFDGYSCVEVICGCAGKDCLQTANTKEECLERFSLCLNRVPECFEERFPITDLDPGAAPAYPEFAFSVEGYAQLYDEETGNIAVFSEWTPARWIGWEEPTAEPERCPSIHRLPGTAICPYVKPLLLEVNGQGYRINVTTLWALPLFSLLRATYTDVSVRIEAHASGTLVLRVRDEETGMPALMVVQSMLDKAAQDVPWKFEPFTFMRQEEKFCRTDPNSCAHTFSPLGLKVATTDQEWNVEPLDFAFVQAEGSTYIAMHAYFFDAYSDAFTPCAADYPSYQSFILMR